MSPYQEMLQSAEALGLRVPEGQHQDRHGLLGFQQLVDSRKEAYELELKLHQLTGYLQSRSVTDQQQLQSRISSLQKAVSTYQQVIKNKDALADRLRSAKTRPSVPVAPAYQQDFSTLLEHSASSAEMLHEGVNSLQWAATLDVKPSCWEDKLKCIVDAAKELDSRMTAMDDFSAAIINSSSSSKATTCSRT